MARTVARWMFSVVIALLAVPPEPARAADLDCAASSATLDELITCVKAGMPRKHSQGFSVPTPDEQADWRTVAWAMLNGSCENVILPASLAESYRITKFLDRRAGREVCVLIETADRDGDGRVDRGWGTLITDPAPLREVIILAPHPLSDRGTHVQGVQVFQGVRARAVLVAGAHRAASERGGDGACGDSRVSDPTHSVETMFQPTLSEAMELYAQLQRDFVVLQFHGMAETTCAGVDVHLSNGSGESVDDRVLQLQLALQQLAPDWTVTTPETDTACGMSGSRNVQVRLLAGVPYEEVCDPRPAPGSPQFVHIEQKREVRSDVDVWVRAVRDTWPRTSAPASLQRAEAVAAMPERPPTEGAPAVSEPLASPPAALPWGLAGFGTPAETEPRTDAPTGTLTAEGLVQALEAAEPGAEGSTEAADQALEGREPEGQALERRPLEEPPLEEPPLEEPPLEGLAADEPVQEGDAPVEVTAESPTQAPESGIAAVAPPDDLGATQGLSPAPPAGTTASAPTADPTLPTAATPR